MNPRYPGRRRVKGCCFTHVFCSIMPVLIRRSMRRPTEPFYPPVHSTFDQSTMSINGPMKPNPVFIHCNIFTALSVGYLRPSLIRFPPRKSAARVRMPNWAIVAGLREFDDCGGFPLQGLKVWKVPPPNRNIREATDVAATQHKRWLCSRG